MAKSQPNYEELMGKSKREKMVVVIKIIVYNHHHNFIVCFSAIIFE